MGVVGKKLERGFSTIFRNRNGNEEVAFGRMHISCCWNCIRCRWTIGLYRAKRNDVRCYLFGAE